MANLMPPYQYRMDRQIREGVERLAKMEERSLNWMLNHLLGPVVTAELAKRECVGYAKQS